MNPPYWPTIAALDYPAPIRKLIRAAEAKYEAWAEANAAHADAKDELETAEIKFQAGITAAAREGAPMPKRPDYTELENAIVYAAEVERVKHHETSKAVQEIVSAFRTHRKTIFELAVAKANKGAETYATAISAISDDLERIEQERRAAYDGLTMSADYATPEVLYRAEFGTGTEVRLPATHENQARAAIASLSNLIEHLDKSETK